MSGKTLETYLKELRKSYNYSQDFVASHLNITRQTYSHYETGRIMPPVNSLYNLSKLYGVSVDSFLELSSNYNINMDYAPAASIGEQIMHDELNEFLDYISTPDNSKKFRLLERHEKLFLYYYQLLDDRDQEDILTFMKVKSHNRKAEQKNAALENNNVNEKKD